MAMGRAGAPAASLPPATAHQLGSACFFLQQQQQQPEQQLRLLHTFLLAWLHATFAAGAPMLAMQRRARFE
eukprot:170242-Chlamydomonas_euryale.AAC.3